MEKEKNFKVEEVEKECSDDDDCNEIDLLEFTEKLSLKVSDNEEGNDVVLVAAKGPVALRDFPHPRHLCGNFPFKSTPHDKHCKQCYCIVCEVPAPCFKWNNGIGEHCHAMHRRGSSGIGERSQAMHRRLRGSSGIGQAMHRRGSSEIGENCNQM